MTTTPQTPTHPTLDRHDRFMSMNYPRYPIVIERGQGCDLYNADGKQYLDLFAGFGASVLGHCHEALVAAVTDQAKRLWHVGNLFHTDPQTRLAQAISTHGFGGRSFFCHSGADANEAAFKLARLYGQAHPGPDGPRFKIIATHHSFHGRSFGTMVATGQAKVSQGFEPLLPGFEHVPYNDLDAMRNATDRQTAAVIVEPIQGEGGINVPDDVYLPGLRELCDQQGVLLICDEVWTAPGRTGKYFAHQHWGIEPDIMTLAKGTGGGLPVGVMCAKPHVAQLYDCRQQGSVKHATTLGGNCLSMAAAAAVFEVLAQDHLVQHAAQLGQHAMDRLTRFAQQCSTVQNVRGKGLFIGIELALDAAGDRSIDLPRIVTQCMEHGVLVNGTQGNVLRIAPPLTISPSQLDHGLEVLEQVVSSL